MAVLADLERFLERLFERNSARVFGTRLQPVQLERRIERAMELGRVVERDRTRVPERLRVRMHPGDLKTMAGGDLDELAARLADSALRAARARGYHLADRPTVSLVADPSVRPGDAEVDARFGDRPGHVPSAASEHAPPATAIPGWAGAPAMAAGGAGAMAAAPIGGSVPAPVAVSIPSPEAPVEIPPADPTRTLVYRKPIVDAPKALLREIRPDGVERAVTVEGAVLTIGRGSDNGLVLDDARVSRHHGRLQARRGTLVYTDTGSTNGTRVNGLVVDEIVLGPGDRLQLGDTILVVETLPG
jgi:FHA domain-containing protein